MRRRLAALLVALGAGALASGCAYVTAQPVKPGDRVGGVRVYDVKPLLVVTGETVKLELVPNYNRAYTLRFGAFLAKNHFKATMSNGVLTGIDANMDTTALVEVLKTLADKVPVGFSTTGQAATGGLKDRFQIYEIVFDDEGNLVGLRPLVTEHNLLRVRTSSGPAASGFSGNTVVVPQQGGGTIVVPQPGGP